MADVKITDLTAITTLASADLFEIVDFDADASRKVSMTQLTTYFDANLSFLSSGDNVSSLTNDAGYLTTISGLNNSLLTNDSGYITGITGSPLSDLSDVTIDTIASGELLKWNGTAWINNTIAEAGLATSAQGTLADSATQPGDNVSTLTNDAGYLANINSQNINDLSDVSIAGAANKNILQRNGSGTWQNKTLNAAGISEIGHSHTKSDITDFSDADYATAAQGALADSATQPGDNISTLTNDSGYITGITGESIKNLSDVYSSMTPTDGQVLTYDTTNGWQAETPVTGVTDHGALTGLADDDHTQYLLATGARQITGSQDFAASTSLTWNSTAILSDSAGTMTLSNIDAIDATTEATIEAAIDTLSNLTSAPSLSITESQISDLGSYITASSTDTLTNKTINGSNNTITNIGTTELEDDAVTFAKAGDEYTLNNGSLGTAVDWSSYATFEKTLSANTTLTDSNLKVGTKYLLIDGNFTLTLPTYWKVVSGAYDGTSSQKNLITVTCFDATASSEVVTVSIVTYT